MIYQHQVQGTDNAITNAIDAPGSEIDELIWLTYADRDPVSPVGQLTFDHLYQNGQIV